MRSRVQVCVALVALLVGCRALIDFPDDPRLADVDTGAGGRAESATAAAPAVPELAIPAISAAPASESSGEADGASALDASGAEPPSAGDRGSGSSGAPRSGPDAGELAPEPDAPPAPPPIVAGARAEPSGDGLAGCVPVTRTSISDFTFAAGASRTQVVFGADAAFAGSTFFYPEGGEDLDSDVSGGDWRLGGDVRGDAGFGINIDCPEIDASAFAGIAFTLWGGNDPSSVVFSVETAAQQVSRAWLDDHEASADNPNDPDNAGRCAPAKTRFDGTCLAPKLTLPVARERTEVRVLWRDLTGGSPESGVDPREITSIAWTLPKSSDDSYSFEVHVDDLRFIFATP